MDDDPRDWLPAETMRVVVNYADNDDCPPTYEFRTVMAYPDGHLEIDEGPHIATFMGSLADMQDLVARYQLALLMPPIPILQRGRDYWRADPKISILSAEEASTLQQKADAERADARGLTDAMNAAWEAAGRPGDSTAFLRSIGFSKSSSVPADPDNWSLRLRDGVVPPDPH